MKRNFNNGGTLVKSPLGRCNWPSIFESSSYQDGPLKFHTEVLFPKDTTDMSDLEKAVAQAKKEQWGDNPPKKWWNPIRCGDTDETFEGDPVYAGMWVVKFATLDKEGFRPPGVFKKLPGEMQGYIRDPKELYSGCWVKVTANAKAFTKGQNGVNFYLDNVCKFKDDDVIEHVTRADAADDFSDENFSDEVEF